MIFNLRPSDFEMAKCIKLNFTVKWSFERIIYLKEMTSFDRTKYAFSFFIESFLAILTEKLLLDIILWKFGVAVRMG